MGGRQLSAARVHEVLDALGWDRAQFEEKIAALDAPEPASSAGPVGPARQPVKSAQAAKRLGITQKTLLRYVQRGWIRAWHSRAEKPSGRRYEFDGGDLDAFKRDHWDLCGGEAAPAPRTDQPEGDAL